MVKRRLGFVGRVRAGRKAGGGRGGDSSIPETVVFVGGFFTCRISHYSSKLKPFTVS